MTTDEEPTTPSKSGPKWPYLAGAALGLAIFVWFATGSDDASACDDFRSLVTRVQDGDQDAMSAKTIRELGEIADLAVDEGGDVAQAGSGLRITLDTLDEDPNAEESLASQVRLMDEACA